MTRDDFAKEVLGPNGRYEGKDKRGADIFYLANGRVFIKLRLPSRRSDVTCRVSPRTPKERACCAQTRKAILDQVGRIYDRERAWNWEG
jgi:hypothetical protein